MLLTDDEAMLLVEGARTLGLDLSAEQLDLFDRYRALLLDWNSRVNLTAITDPAQVLTRHVLDSLTVVLALPRADRARPLRVMDVGAGAGLPGLALRIALPAWRVTLLDSVGKKTRFVEHAATTLGLDGVTVLTARAEDAAHDRAHRERYDLCLARAVAPLRVLAEYTLPFCAVGGLMVAMKKGDLDTELTEGRRAVGQVGGRIEPGVRVPALADLGDDRLLIPCRKVAPTRRDLPRQAGTPAKRPL